jgi:DHA2 family multidrug resistance protein
MLTRRAQFHQSRLVENMQGLNPSYPDFTQQLAHTYGTTADSSLTLASIYQTVVQQANLLSYLDAFKLLGVVFLALLPLLLLVKPGKGGGGAIPAH